jgi:hypothetical protein
VFDPRSDIISKFTNSKISATGKYGTEYIELDIRERNPEGVMDYESQGVLLFEPPQALYPEHMNIGGLLYQTPVQIRCNLWIKKGRDLDYQVDTFINSILHSFQNTIVSNQTGIITNGIVRFAGVDDVPSNSSDLIRKSILLICQKYEDYSS